MTFERRPFAKGVITEIREDLRLPVDARHDDVVAIQGGGRRCAGPFGPSEHIEEGQRVTTARLDS